MPLTFTDYQTAARKTAVYPIDSALYYLALGLTNEAGEVAGKVKKSIRDNGGRLDVDALAAELGDVLWYIAELATYIKTDLGDLAQSNLDKLQDRFSRGVIGGSGDDR